MATLVIVGGPAEGEQFALEKHRLVMIGRDEQCSFQIVDSQMSRRHLQIRLSDGEDAHFAVDFGSHNGVLVNGRQIAAETLLADGDLIELGATKIMYSRDDAPDAQRVKDMLRKRGEGWKTTALPD